MSYEHMSEEELLQMLKQYNLSGDQQELIEKIEVLLKQLYEDLKDTALINGEALVELIKRRFAASFSGVNVIIVDAQLDYPAEIRQVLGKEPVIYRIHVAYRDNIYIFPERITLR